MGNARQWWAAADRRCSGFHGRQPAPHMLWSWVDFHGDFTACFSKIAKHTVRAFSLLSALHQSEGAAFTLVVLKECQPAAISAVRGINASLLGGPEFLTAFIMSGYRGFLSHLLPGNMIV